jgi:hypothetical protein
MEEEPVTGNDGRPASPEPRWHEAEPAPRRTDDLHARGGVDVRLLGTVVVAACSLLVGAAVGAMASRIVVGVAGVRDWDTDLIVTMVTTGIACAATAFVLCERLVPRLDRRARRPTPPPRRTVRRASLLAGALLSALLVPVTPETWLQALPAGAFVAVTGGLGVAASALRERLRR